MGVNDAFLISYCEILISDIDRSIQCFVNENISISIYTHACENKMLHSSLLPYLQCITLLEIHACSNPRHEVLMLPHEVLMLHEIFAATRQFIFFLYLFQKTVKIKYENKTWKIKLSFTEKKIILSSVCYYA